MPMNLILLEWLITQSSNESLFQVWTPVPWDITVSTYVSAVAPPFTASVGRAIF